MADIFADAEYVSRYFCRSVLANFVQAREIGADNGLERFVMCQRILGLITRQQLIAAGGEAAIKFTGTPINCPAYDIDKHRRDNLGAHNDAIAAEFGFAIPRSPSKTSGLSRTIACRLRRIKMPLIIAAGILACGWTRRSSSLPTGLAGSGSPSTSICCAIRC